MEDAVRRYHAHSSSLIGCEHCACYDVTTLLFNLQTCGTQLSVHDNIWTNGASVLISNSTNLYLLPNERCRLQFYFVNWTITSLIPQK